jgi:hypothetical protein
MKKIFLLLINIITLFKIATSQILTQSTSSTLIVSQIPGYSEISSINTRIFNYTPSVPPTPPNPIDEDTTTEDPKEYRFGDVLSVNITMGDGNITTTSLGKSLDIKD